MPHHSQYDAVIRRIQKAQRQTASYVNCSSSGITKQD